MDAIKNTY